jgi:hypothetical protein
MVDDATLNLTGPGEAVAPIHPGTAECEPLWYRGGKAGCRGTDETDHLLRDAGCHLAMLELVGWRCLVPGRASLRLLGTNKVHRWYNARRYD